jgi:TolB protein
LPDGTDEMVVDSGPSSQPPTAVTWSPDGSRLAWSSMAAEGPVVAVAEAGGGDLQRVPTPFPSFFLLWDGPGERLASLGTANGGVSLNVIGDEAGEILVTGQPLYLSWAPDGASLVAHRSDDLRIVDADGGDTVVPVPDGFFATPVWLDDGRVVFATADDAETVVQVGDLAADGRGDELLRVQGRAALVADDAGERLAVAVVGPSAESGLYVVDLTTGASTHIADEPGLWWTWSPDGSRLLVMTLSASAGRAGWSVWDGTTFDVVVEAFRPTTRFVADYLPFADQWDLAVDLWSPDSTAFAFAGVSPAGQSTVFVQNLDGGLPDAVGGGSFVTWSPT